MKLPAALLLLLLLLVASSAQAEHECGSNQQPACPGKQGH